MLTKKLYDLTVSNTENTKEAAGTAPSQHITSAKCYPAEGYQDNNFCVET